MTSTQKEMNGLREYYPSRLTSPSLPQRAQKSQPPRLNHILPNANDPFLNCFSRINQEPMLSITPLKRPKPMATCSSINPRICQQSSIKLNAHQQQLQQDIVIYRNAKYNGVFGRFIAYGTTYVQLMLLQPMVPIINEFHNYFLELLGFIYFILMTAPHLLLALILLLSRKCRLLLVKKYYPAAVVCEDLSPRCIFIDKSKSVDLVTCVIWMKGKLDVPKLRSYFQAKSTASILASTSAPDAILHKRITERFGVRVLCDLDANVSFDIRNHIEEAPKKFLKFFIREETIRQYGKSALQQFVTKCASDKLNHNFPPWKITVIPQPVFEKEKTCCVLRFHYILLQNCSVNKLLDDLFTQCIYQDQPRLFHLLSSPFPGEASHCALPFSNANDHHVPASNEMRYLENNNKVTINTNHEMSQHGNYSEAVYDLSACKNNYCDRLCSRLCQCEDPNFHEDHTSNDELIVFQPEAFQDVLLDFEMPIKAISNYIRKVAEWSQLWIHSNLYFTAADIRTWMNLYHKQFQFHSKIAIAKSVSYEFTMSVQRFVQSVKHFPQSCHGKELKYILTQALLICRATCFVPVEVFSCLLHTYPRGGNGFRKSDNESHRISWSSPISKNLLNAISKQTGATTDSIILTACSLALKEYYCETNIPNPKRLGVIVPIVTKELLAPAGYSTLDLHTENLSVCGQLQMLDTKIREFPAWKLLGNYFIVKYLSYILPRPIVYLVFRKIFKRYPISFTKLNLQSPTSILLPHISIWGQPVEEFLYWRPPQSDYCVSISLVNYSENLRLSVLSPMKSLDVALTQKFCQHLNRIAEAVGVNKNLIPYSRKSSPVSTHCSSPSVPKVHEAILSCRR